MDILCLSAEVLWLLTVSLCLFFCDILQVKPLAPLGLCPVGPFSNPSMTVSSDFSQVSLLCECLQEMPGGTLHSPYVKTHTPPTLLHSSTPPAGSVIFVLHHHSMPSYARKSLCYNAQYFRAWKLFRMLQLLFVKSRQSCYHFFFFFFPSHRCMGSWETRENVGSVVN